MADNENMQLKISVFKGSHTNTTPSEVIDNWADLCDLLGNVKEGEKDGDYFIRGFCDGERSDENLKSISLLIIDGDSTLTNGASCVPPRLVHKVMVDAGIRSAIHTSYSNDLVNNRHKWRMVVPCRSLFDKDDVIQGTREIIKLLNDNGLPVRNVTENRTLSQAWYFPRCKIGMIDDFYCDWHDGEKEAYTIQGLDIGLEFNNLPEGQKRVDSGIFSWESIYAGFASGTLHQGLVSATGWLILTTDWRDAQIKQMLSGLVSTLCPDKEKVIRATEGKEIDKIIKHCRSKAGLTVEAPRDWREHHVDGAELQHKEFPSVKWAVDDLVPEGLVIIAGAPKVGKSLLAVDIVTAIATGGCAFGHQRCVSGSSVYISLEDNQSTVQGRIKQQCDLWSSKLHVVTGGVGYLDLDFYKMMDEWVLQWSDLRCIVIDILDKVVPEKPTGMTDYSFYNRLLDPLHKWGKDNQIAVIAVTHKGKAPKSEGSNPFSGIIGSVAIQGSADALLILDRNFAKEQDKTNVGLADGFLEATGREVPAEKYSLDFDSEAVMWSLKGKIEPRDLTSNTNWLLILEELKREKLKPKAISERTKINLSTIRSALKRMRTKEMVDTDDSGFYWCCGVDYKEDDNVWD